MLRCCPTLFGCECCFLDDARILAVPAALYFRLKIDVRFELLQKLNACHICVYRAQHLADEAQSPVPLLAYK
jgi:hypothetical protein